MGKSWVKTIKQGREHKCLSEKRNNGFQTGILFGLNKQLIDSYIPIKIKLRPDQNVLGRFG